MLFISDVQYYVPKKLCKTAGSIHLFKITGTIGTVRTVQDIHTFIKDHTMESSTCSPWSMWMKPLPSIQKD